MAHEFVINEPVRSCCGKPTANCSCGGKKKKRQPTGDAADIADMTPPVTNFKRGRVRNQEMDEDFEECVESAMDDGMDQEEAETMCGEGSESDRYSGNARTNNAAKSKSNEKRLEQAYIQNLWGNETNAAPAPAQEAPVVNDSGNWFYPGWARNQ